MCAVWGYRIQVWNEKGGSGVGLALIFFYWNFNNLSLLWTFDKVIHMGHRVATKLQELFEIITEPETSVGHRDYHDWALPGLLDSTSSSSA